MIVETFEIRVKKWTDNKVYRMQVEKFYESDQILRFRITAGGKTMILEKQIIKKSNQWKIKETDFPMTGDPKSSAMAIMHIQDAIDHHINRK